MFERLGRAAVINRVAASNCYSWGSFVTESERRALLLRAGAPTPPIVTAHMPPNPCLDATHGRAMADDTKVEALCEELRSIDVGDAVKVIGTWLEEHSLKQVLDSFHEAVLTDPTILGAQATLVSVPPPPAVQEKPPNAAPLTAPPADALPVPAASTSSRPGKLYDAEPISSSQVSGELLTKPDPVFHGERDERQREAAPVYEFPMHVRLLARTPPRSCGAHRAACGYADRCTTTRSRQVSSLRVTSGWKRSR
jgi:hypothetical protein